MEERREPKLAHRLIPCPQYDVSGMECWLSDMAKQGLLLQKDGIFAGIATFEKTSPQIVKYRLQPAEKSTSMWADILRILCQRNIFFFHNIISRQHHPQKQRGNKRLPLWKIFCPAEK